MMQDKQPYYIYALPGFLGTAKDWDGSPFVNIEGVDICSSKWVDRLGWVESKEGPIGTWARSFNQFVAENRRTETPLLLFGYSMGARFAMHALIDNPQLWSGAALVSGHPGIKDPEARYQKLQRDTEWAKQFEVGSWTKVMDSWNNQDVFANDSFIFSRKESDYEKNKLSRLLQRGSLGLQKDLRAALMSLPMPILWACGELDSRSRQLLPGLSFQHALSRVELIKQAGHRAPWENPKDFWSKVENFVDALLQESLIKKE